MRERKKERAFAYDPDELDNHTIDSLKGLYPFEEKNRSEIVEEKGRGKEGKKPQHAIKGE